MVKIIKKSIKYFIIVAGIIIMPPTLLYLVLQVPEVQTLIVQRITSHFSDELKSSITVSKVEFKFFNRLVVSDILIKDKNNDTLIYSQRITAGIRGVDFKSKSFRLGRVSIVKPEVAIITDSSGVTNLSWYLDLLKTPSDTTRKSGGKISIDQIDISHAKFSLINRNALQNKTGIDFNNLKLTKVNGIIEDLKIVNDSTTFNIYNLAFKEKSGFFVNRLSASVLLSNQEFLFNSVSLNSDSSIINIGRFGMKADSADSFKRFTDEVKLDAVLERSLISSTDLRYFIPSLSGFNESVWLSGKIMGTVSELRGRDINLSYSDSTALSCDFDLSGLPEIDNTYIYIGVSSLKTNIKDIEKIRIPGNGNIVMPETLHKLGNISFDGSFTGFLTDFVTYGEFRTSQGNIRTDISLRPEESKRYKIKGLLTCRGIDLGNLTGKTDLLGKVSMKANVDGYAYSLNKFAGNLTGNVDSIEINSYKYRNVSLNGFFTEKTWDGSIKVADKNIKMDFLGLFNFKNALPEFDFTLNLARANLYKLNVDKADTSSSLTLLLTSNFKGNSIDNLDGEIKLLNSNFIKHNKNLELYDFSIKTYSENNKPVLSLRTDFVDADIIGYYNFATIGDLIKTTLSKLMPSQFPESGKHNYLINNDFTFDINFKNTDKINDFLRTGILLTDKSTITGSIFPDSIIHIEGEAKSLTIKNNVFHDFSFNLNIADSVLDAQIKSSTLSVLEQSELKDFVTDLKTEPDNFIFTVDWNNRDKNLDKGLFIARGSIAKNTHEKSNAILTVSIDSTHVISNNNLWKISNSSIVVDSNSIQINRLLINNNDHFYKIEGSVSENPSDTLHLEFEGIDISPLNYFAQRNNSDPNKIPLNIRGELNGKILLTNVYHDLLLESNLTVDNFSILSSNYGDILIRSAWDKDEKVININASNNLGGIKMFDVAGNYNPAQKKIDLSAKAAKLPVGFLNPLLKVFASDIKGTASGNLKLHGEADNLTLNGGVMMENTSLKVDYLQTVYKINDTVRFDNEGIKFNNIKVTDPRGNFATLSGAVYHKNFQIFNPDLVININSKNFLVLNTQAKDNSLFYGTVYASGVTKIKSGPNTLSFDISAKTGENSKFFIPLSNNLSVSDNSFISFVDSTKNKEGHQTIVAVDRIPATPKQLGMDINIDLEVTPDAEAQIIFDSKVGDKITGSGSGMLNINLNPKGEFKISGDYVIENGDYLFTAGNLLNKKFVVENGGKIMFNGDIDNAEIELKAIYKNLEASLSPILGDTYKNRVRVEPQLYLSGKLFNPIVKFDINLPNSDEETKTLVRNAITSEEELNRQFVYLLVMNSFYYAGSATSTGTSAMAVTTTEMISTQLSNWLSQISNDFDLGFVYRPGRSNNNLDINPQELQVALSTQLLNDKVILNGNLDVMGTSGAASNNTGQIMGDFDAEIKLTEKLRLKVFNRVNDIYTGLGPYTQGIGILFTKDFNKFSDLFKKKVKSDMKKEDEPSIKKK
jgi:hypothetical protein